MVKKSDNPNRPKSNREIQEALIENFVNMQRVLTDLSFKFDSLSENMSRLLRLFEVSAKTFIEKQETGENKIGMDDKETIKKLEVLLEQNKTIARGLTLIEEKIKHKIYPDNPKETDIEDMSGRPRPKPLPRM
jgi:hypothetical protein